MVESSNTSSDKSLANFSHKRDNKKTVCEICNKTVRTKSLKRHIRRVHSGSVEPPPTVEKQSQREKVMTTCEVCNKPMTRKHLKRHIKTMHPDHPSLLHTEPTHDSSEGNPAKRLKTSDQGHFDSSEVSTKEPQERKAKSGESAGSKCGEGAESKCGCGTSFDKKIYMQVHETLYHKRFSALKRCEITGCFGLFLNDQIYSQHRTCVH
jgi:hypothetical protein